MCIGKNIYELRMSKGMSQEALANMLNVSRQSVSKWETDSAVPDLDKLMKLCDIFEVSLDGIVGRQAIESQKSAVITQKSSVINSQKIIGIVLLAVSLIGGLLVLLLTDERQDFYITLSVIISVFACSLICLFVRRNAVYWCVWSALAPLVVLMPSIVSLHFAMVGFVIRIIAITAMSLVANKIFSEVNTNKSTVKSIALIFAWIAYFLLHLFDGPLMNIGFSYFIAENSILWGIASLLTTYTVCYLKNILRRLKDDLYLLQIQFEDFKKSKISNFSLFILFRSVYNIW